MIHPRRLVLLSLLATLAVPAVWAADAPTEISGVRFEPRVQLGGHSVVLNGLGLRARSILKGYAAGLYLSQRTTAADQAVAQAGPKRLQIRMMLDVPVAEFVKAFHKGVDRNTPVDQHAGLADRMAAFDAQMQPLGKVHTGDTVNLDYVPGKGMVMTHNGKVTGDAIPGADFYSAILLIFLGDKPVDDRLKQGLLGQPA